MGFFYCIPLRDLLVKLNIKPECAAINLLTTRCLPSFFKISLPGCMGKEGNSHILAYIYDVPFYGTQFWLENKIFGSIF